MGKREPKSKSEIPGVRQQAKGAQPAVQEREREQAASLVHFGLGPDLSVWAIIGAKAARKRLTKCFSRKLFCTLVQAARPKELAS